MANATIKSVIQVVDQASPQLQKIAANHDKISKTVKQQRDAQKLLNDINTRAKVVQQSLMTSQQLYSRELKKLNQLHNTGQISAAQYSTAMRNLKIAYQGTTQAGAVMGRTMTRQMRAGFGQLGHQIQDVAVQLQMGQQAMLVFAQQGSQIASLFGPWGAAAGAVMAVGGALAMTLIPNLKETKIEADEVVERFNRLRDAMPAGMAMGLGSAVNAARMRSAQLASEQERKKQMQFEKDREKLQKQLQAAQSPKGLFPGIADFFGGKTTGLSAEKIKEIKDEIADLDLKIANSTVTILENNEAHKQSEEAIEKLAKAANGLNQEWQDYLDESAIAAIEEQNKEMFKRSEELLQEHNKKRQELKSLGLIGEETALKDSYVRQLEIVQQYADQEIITEQEKADAIARINRNMQKAAVGEFSKGIDALGAYNKKAFKIAKGVKTAEAIMNTYAGANQALAAYPPPFSYIAAAGQIAFGMAQVAQIKSQTFAGRAAGGMVQAGQPYMVGEMGKEMFIPSTSGRIANNNEVQAGMGANITFNISTVDARGFDELLNSRRGQIVNMVNRAMNDRGRAGVTA